MGVVDQHRRQAVEGLARQLPGPPPEDALLRVGEPLPHRDLRLPQAPGRQLGTQVSGPVGPAGEDEAALVALHLSRDIVGAAVGGDRWRSCQGMRHFAHRYCTQLTPGITST